MAKATPATRRTANKRKPAAKKTTTRKTTTKTRSTRSASDKSTKSSQDIDKFLTGEGLDSDREQEIGQHIGYRYDVNLLPDYDRLTPFLKTYIELMGWDDLNWLEDVHMGYEEGRPAVFDRNINGWVTVPENIKLPNNQQDRDMIARELLIRFQMSPKHPLFELKKAYAKF
jgi:hypothetical protein